MYIVTCTSFAIFHTFYLLNVNLCGLKGTLCLIVLLVLLGGSVCFVVKIFILSLRDADIMFCSFKPHSSCVGCAQMFALSSDSLLRVLYHLDRRCSCNKHVPEHVYSIRNVN